ncbi:MAG: FAD:protein FMN transferase [Eubacteriales bacterium]|nr:FAD:protein FMN transferase [Eubacteriales bacterium]
MISNFHKPYRPKLKGKYFFPVLFIFCLVPVFLGGCGRVKTDNPVKATSFKLNTVVQVTLYDAPDPSLADKSLKLCDNYEAVFSRTSKDSELYKLNHRELPLVQGTSDTYQVSEPLAELLSLGLKYTEESDGAFDIAIAPLTSLWDFTSENPQVPDTGEINKAVSASSSKGVSIDGRNVTLESPDTQFDLGAIAKGYIADRMKDFLVSEGVKSAAINLGGNVLCIGEKSQGVPFKIGVQKPFADRNETIAVMDITDKTVVSSGIYERYFEKDGTLYHHLLNPNTGFPYDNDLISVTIITDNSVDGDALSTTCFALGYEKGLAYAQSQDNVEAIFITKDYQVHYTENFRDNINITLTENDPDSIHS